MIKLNLGCGNRTVPSWVNVDYALGAKLAKVPFFNRLNQRIHVLKLTWDRDIFVHDLRTQFPWDDAYADIIYSSHTLEHFSKDEGRFFLQECYRVLKNGGILRILVPDLRILVKRYIQGAVRADDFLTTLVVTYESAQDGMLRKKFAPLFRSPHKCLYDQESLSAIMQDIGFDVLCKAPFESTIPDITTIEHPNRVKDVVIVEGKKP